MQSPGSKNNSKKRAEKGPAQRLRQRTAILILLILVLGFGAAVLRLTYLTTIQSSELQESAVDLQLAGNHRAYISDGDAACVTDVVRSAVQL